MTHQTYLILYGLIIFLALQFLLLSYGFWLWKKPEPSHPEIAFRWPDRIELQYTNAAGETTASRLYVPE